MIIWSKDWLYVYSGRGIWIRRLNADYEDSFCLSPPPFDWLRQTPVGEVRSSDTPLTLVALQWTPTTDMDGKSHIVTHSKKILKTNTQNKSIFFSISFVVFFIYVVHFFAIGKSLKRGVLSFGNCPTGISDDIVSSVRSSNSHPDLLVIHHNNPTIFRSHRSSTLDFHFLSH